MRDVMAKIRAPNNSRLTAGYIVAAACLTLLMLTGYGSVAVSRADSSWAQRAESECSRIYGSMGTPDSSSNPDDNMALYDYWHSAALSKTANALKSIPGSTAKSDQYVKGIAYLAGLVKKDAVSSANHEGTDLDLWHAIDRVKKDLASRAAALNVPTCDKIVQG